MFKRQSQAERDHELLTAYIDNRLSASERAQFEARLAAEPALRAELDELRQLVRAVRGMPRVAVPRSFALDPKRYAPRQSFLTRIYPTLRAANAAVALLFLIVLGGLVATTLSPAMAPQAGAVPPGALDVQSTTSTEPAQAPMPAATMAAASASPESDNVSPKAELTPTASVLTAPQVMETPAPTSQDGTTRAAATPPGAAGSGDITNTVPTTETMPVTVVPEPEAGTVMAMEVPTETPQPGDTYGYSATATPEASRGTPPSEPRPWIDLKSLASLLGVIFLVLLVVSSVARRQMRR